MFQMCPSENSSSTFDEVIHLACELCGRPFTLPAPPPAFANSTFLPFDYFFEESETIQENKPHQKNVNEIYSEKHVDEKLSKKTSENSEERVSSRKTIEKDLNKGSFKALELESGLRFEGTLIDFEMSGFGRLFSNDKVIYIGHFDKNNFSGFGQQFNPDLDESEYSKAANPKSTQEKDSPSKFSQISSGAVLSSLVWVSYEGLFRESLRSGKGCLKLQGGDRYIGDFENDDAEGRGIYVSKEGRLAGMWKEGKFVAGDN